MSAETPGEVTWGTFQAVLEIARKRQAPGHPGMYADQLSDMAMAIRRLSRSDLRDRANSLALSNAAFNLAGFCFSYVLEASQRGFGYREIGG